KEDCTIMSTESMSTPPSDGVLQKAAHRSIVVSILMIVAGILAIIAPTAAGLAVNVMVGWLLVVTGVAHFVYAWSLRHHGGVFSSILLGILYCLVGGFLLMNPVAGLVALTFALALYLFAQGVVEFILSFELHRLPGWGWLLFHGIVTLIVAFMVLRT